MRYFLLLTVLTVGLMSGVTEASEIQILGAGLQSCGAWTAHKRAYRPGGPVNLDSQSALEDGSWVVGFLSGIGMVHDKGADPLKGTDAQGVWAWVDNYCLANPIKKIMDASVAFYFAHPHP